MSDQQTNKDLEPVQESRDNEIDEADLKETEEASKQVEEQEAVKSLVNESVCTPFEDALEAQEIVSLPVNNTKHMPDNSPGKEEPILEEKKSNLK